jgi:hypothetical protein
MAGLEASLQESGTALSQEIMDVQRLVTAHRASAMGNAVTLSGVVVHTGASASAMGSGVGVPGAPVGGSGSGGGLVGAGGATPGPGPSGSRGFLQSLVFGAGPLGRTGTPPVGAAGPGMAPPAAVGPLRVSVPPVGLVLDPAPVRVAVDLRSASRGTTPSDAEDSVASPGMEALLGTDPASLLSPGSAEANRALAAMMRFLKVLAAAAVVSPLCEPWVIDGVW